MKKFTVPKFLLFAVAAFALALSPSPASASTDFSDSLVISVADNDVGPLDVLAVAALNAVEIADLAFADNVDVTGISNHLELTAPNPAHPSEAISGFAHDPGTSITVDPSIGPADLSNGYRHDNRLQYLRSQMSRWHSRSHC